MNTKITFEKLQYGTCVITVKGKNMYNDTFIRQEIIKETAVFEALQKAIEKKRNIMTAKEYLERDNKVWKKIDDINLTKATMIEFAQNYLDYISETTMNEEITELIKRLETEISKTPTGELRNLLCEANITIQALNIAVNKAHMSLAKMKLKIEKQQNNII